MLYNDSFPINLLYSKNLEIESAYIITLENNYISENYSKNCAESCDKINQPYKIWYGYDGTSEQGLKIPPQCMESMFMRMVKVTDHYLTRTELACALSHISLWFHCLIIDRPIIILEHDAIMVKKLDYHDALNSIIFLGCKEWKTAECAITSIPVMSCEGNNYLFINRAHAYSIDPFVAKNMVANVIKYGVNMPLDMMIRADLYNIVHRGLYAYDKNIEGVPSTISNRPPGRTTIRNDNFKY